MNNAVKLRPFGASGQFVTMVGLGGEGILRTFGRDDDARRVIQKALDETLMYFDSASAYKDSERYYGAVWKDNPQVRQNIFQTSKSVSRYRDSALKELDQTLMRLETDYLDLWQIHDIRTRSDLDAISGPGGAIEAFLEAKTSGKVRFIGVTGHHDPYILAEAVRSLPVDSVMMPVNPVEGILGGFLTETLSAAKSKNIAVIGMKLLGGSHYIMPRYAIDADMLIRYALSCDISVGIVGCSSPSEVEILADIGKEFTPLSEIEKNRIHQYFEPHAKRLAYYRGVL